MSVYGLEIRDANNNVTLSVSDRITRQIGSFNTGTGSGSLSVGVAGTVWFAVIDSVPTASQSTLPPNVVGSGSVIQWSPASSSYPTRSVLVIYGVY